MVDPDVFPQRWFYSIRNPKGKCVDALSSDGQDNVQQTFVRFHVFIISKVQCRIVTGKGDPQSRSASAKDIARDRALDRSLEDPPPLPSWVAAEERRTSRVDVDVGGLSYDDESTRFSDLVPFRCYMHPPRLMHPFLGFIFTKIIHNSVLALNNAAQ